MNIADLKWFNLQAQATETDIQVVENVLGTNLPEDYLNFAQFYHGAYPIGWTFNALASDNRTAIGSLAVILSFIENEYHDDILSVNGLRLGQSGHFPLGLIAIGRNGGLGYTCLDYRENKTNPKIVFWVRNDNPEIVYDVANDFTDFISKSYYRST